MHTPKVTILTVCINALTGVRITEETVRSQQFQNVEHVIVDGGSSDGTTAFLRSDHIGPWVSEPDRGISDALNKGWQMATGDYLLVLGAGDTFKEATSLARAAPHLDTDIVAFDTELIDDRRSYISSPKAFMRRNMLKPFCHQGVFCRRDLVSRFGYFDERYRISMDYEFQLRAMQGGATFKSVPLTLSRMRLDGISSRRDRESLLARFAEERRAQREHWRTFRSRAFLAGYWPLYLAYRSLRLASGDLSAPLRALS